MGLYDITGLGTIVARKNPSKIILCMGYNDFSTQQSYALFGANAAAFVAEVRAILPTTKIYMGGPWYTANTNTLTPAGYRAQMQTTVTGLADANVIWLNTLAATTSNNPSVFTDGVHPNDTGHQEIATYLHGIIP